MNRIISAQLVFFLFAAPACAGGGALSALTGPVGLAAVVPAVSAPAAAPAKSAQSWTDAVKKAYQRQLETGKLFTLPELKRAELPAAAQKQLDRDNKGVKTAAAYKLAVNGQPAFVVHNRKDGRSLAAHIFEAGGKLVAVAKAASSSPVYWENLGSYTSGGSGFYGPDDVWDGMGGQGPSYGGPDDTYDGGGCGGSGGWGGNSGGPDDAGGNGL